MSTKKWKNKRPLGIDPGGHHFVVLYVSINKKPVFVSAVVSFRMKIQRCLLDEYPVTHKLIAGTLKRDTQLQLSIIEITRKLHQNTLFFAFTATFSRSKPGKLLLLASSKQIRTPGVTNRTAQVPQKVR
jgi:hypothetical protein